MIMKKTILLLAAVAAMVSCQREQDFRPDAPDSSPAIASALPSTLTATIEQGISKAGFEYDAAGKTYSHFWNDGDLIAYFAGDDRPNLYECTDAQNGGFALSKASKLTTTRATYAKNYAIYPDDVLIGATYDYYAYDEELVELDEMNYGAGYPISTTDPPVINVVVPKTDQLKYGNVTYGYGNILVSQMDGGNTDHIQFQSVMGWLKIQLTGAAPMTEVRVTADQTLDNINLSGVGHISFGQDGTPTLTMETNRDFEVYPYKIFKFDSENPMVLDQEVPTPVYLALPPTEFSNGFTVKVSYADGQTTELTTTNHIVIERNAVTPMKARQVRIMKATLDQGTTFNNKLKTLANNGTNVAFTAADSKIKGIKLETGSNVTSGTVVSASTSETPVYAVFDSGTGIVTLHTAAYIVYLNSNITQMFYNMQKAKTIPWDKLDGSNVTLANQLFQNCGSLQTIGDVSLPLATTSHNLFGGCSLLSSVGNIDLPETTMMTNAFNNCVELESIGTINVPKVTNISYMFQNCYKLTEFGDIDFPNATNASYLFKGCKALASIGEIDLPLATNVSYLFNGCIALASIGEIALPLATNADQMFYGCTALTSVGDLSLPEATSTYYVFGNCTSLQTVGAVTLPKTTTCSSMFSGDAALTSIGAIQVPKLNNAASMFYGCSALTAVNITMNTAGSYTTQSLRSMFEGCTNLIRIDGTIAAQNVTDLSRMFYNCSSLQGTLALGGLQGLVTNMTEMFSGCSALTRISFHDNLTNNTSGVTSFSRMFYGCSSLTQIDGITHLNTSAATNLSRMFYGCSSLVTLTLDPYQDYWNTSKVTDMTEMFSGCTALTAIRSNSTTPAHLVTTSLTSTVRMFRGCENLEMLDVSGLAGNISSLQEMFSGCAKLQEIKLMAGFNSGPATSYYGVFSDCSALTSLYIKGFHLVKANLSNPSAGLMNAMRAVGVDAPCTVHYTALAASGEFSSTYCYSVNDANFGLHKYSQTGTLNWTTAN